MEGRVPLDTVKCRRLLLQPPRCNQEWSNRRHCDKPMGHAGWHRATLDDNTYHPARYWRDYEECPTLQDLQREGFSLEDVGV